MIIKPEVKQFVIDVVKQAYFLSRHHIATLKERGVFLFNEKKPLVKSRIEKLGIRMDKPLAVVFQDIILPGHEKHTAMEKDVCQAIIGQIKFGFWIIIVFFVFFFVWGGFAPIDSAVVAPGSVSLKANRKTIQHLEGGIILEILVNEGDFVKKGQPLIYLNPTSANAQQSLLMGQLLSAIASESRLVALRDGADSIKFPDEFTSYADKNKVAEVLDSQKRFFETKKSALQGRVSILEERINQYGKQKVGLETQVKEVNRQLAIVYEQISVARQLFEKGYGAKTKLLELQSYEASLNGKKAEYEAQVATTEGSISEMKLQILNEKNNALKEVMDELKDVQQRISDFREQLNASGDVLERTVITAPQSGKITGLQSHTIGGVIMPGAALMDIIPQDDSLQLEVYVQTKDIDVVHEGLPAKIMLTAYRSRIAPRLDGKVTYVSADKFTDDKTGRQYYMSYVKIDGDSMKKDGDGMTLYPGMPAEVFITTGETTMLKYLLRPLMDSMRRSVTD